MMRDSKMLPTRSLTASGQSTQLSCTSRALSPSLAATAATCRVWLDWTPPIDTSVSAPSRKHVGDDVLELAGLVAAVGEA